MKKIENAKEFSSNYRIHLIDMAKSTSAETEELFTLNTEPDRGDFPLIDISDWLTVSYLVSGERQIPE